MLHEQETSPVVQQLSTVAKVLQRDTVSMPSHWQSTSLMLFPLLSLAWSSAEFISTVSSQARCQHRHATSCSHHTSTHLVALHPSLTLAGSMTSHPSSSSSPALALALASCGKDGTPVTTWKFASVARGEDEFLHDQGDAGMESTGNCPSV